MLPLPHTPLSLGYIVDSDLEDESEDGPTNYPVDEGDDDDDDDSFGDDADDEDKEKAFEEEEEEEEHLAPANSTIVSPVVDLVPFVEETKPFETNESAATPPPPAYRTTARMSVQSQAPIPFPSKAEVARLLAILTPPSLLTPLSSPLPQIPSPPLLIPSPPLPPPPSPLLLNPLLTVGKSSSAAAARPTSGYREDYGFIGTLDANLRHDRAQSMGCSMAVHNELQAYQTHTQIQDTRISSREALVTTLVSQTTSLQTQLIAALGRIDTLEAWELAHTDDPEDADSYRVADALAEHDADRSRNGDDSHDSGSDGRRRMPIARERKSSQVCHLYPTRECFDVVELPREIKKLEIKIWNLKVNGTDVESYTQRFQELALLCGRMFPDESDKDAIEFATELIDQKIRTLGERHIENKRKCEV
ncbi:hypothetical protein Tco_0860771 [Tanacetum coccineum]|uniref:Retrotransposon gag domain-containing protein n=1 Tax=Tanacetum coccineum TaxID=301880 RepID=A0ABQ5BHM0_9ASTR